VIPVAPNRGAPMACPSNDPRVALFGLLLETNARLERQLGAALEAAMGLPLSWFEVLLRVERSDGGYLSMSELASQTVYSSGGTTRLIDRIEAKGLVERGTCPSDRRGVNVRLTEDGRRTLFEALELHAGHLDTFVTSKLTEAERDELESALRKLNGGPPACLSADGH
jgi:MarR family transcriptional regulator, 2-MHQ and catechol-resistance regulon repressor